MSEQAGAAHQWVRHSGGRIKFEVPVGWVTDHIDDKTVKITSPDGISVEFRYFTTGAAEAMKDEKALTKPLEKMVRDLKLTQAPRWFNQYGLAGFGAGGVGFIEEAPVAFFSVAIGDLLGHGVVAVGFGPQLPWMGQQRVIARMIDSIQPDEG